MENLSNDEMLQYAIESGIIDMRTIQKQIEMNIRQDYLSKHEFSIWQGKNGGWYTYLPDITKKDGRKLVKRTTKNALEDLIVETYKAKEIAPMVCDVFVEWMEYKRKYNEISISCYDRYKCDYDRFIKGTKFETKKVKSITDEYLEEFVKDTIVTNELTAKGYAGLRTLLNGIFKYAKKNKYTNFSVSAFFADIDLSRRIFKHNKKQEFDVVFNDYEFNTLIEYLRDNPTIDNLGILIAAYTGMRVGEICALQAEDVKEGFIYVHRAQVRYKVDGKYHFENQDDTKTEAGIRTIPIADALQPIIDKLLEIHPTGELFTKNGKLITTQAMNKCLYKACDNIGIKRRSMHKLRKTFATRLLNARVDDAIIIHLMGHTTIATTKQYYYFNNKGLKEMQSQLNGIF